MSKNKKLKKGDLIPEKSFMRLLDYVSVIQCEMRVCNWKLTISPVLRSNGALASIHTSGEGRTATMRFSPSFFRQSRQEQRHTVAHELAHLLTDDLHEYILSNTFPAAGPKKSRAMQTRFVDVLNERLVDSIAVTVADRLPLPPKLS